MIAQKKTNKHPHFWKAAYYSFLFTVFYTPFMCVENITSTLQEEGGFGELGYLMLGLSYGMHMVGAIISSAVAAKIGIKKSSIIGALLSSSFVFCQIAPAWRVTVMGDNPDDHG